MVTCKSKANVSRHPFLASKLKHLDQQPINNWTTKLVHTARTFTKTKQDEKGLF